MLSFCFRLIASDVVRRGCFLEPRHERDTGAVFEEFFGPGVTFMVGVRELPFPYRDTVLLQLKLSAI